MRSGRFVVTCVVLFVVALVWNALVHLVLLRGSNEAVAQLHRADLGETMWLALALTAGVVTVFTWGWRRFARDGSLRDGMTYGLFFAVLTGLLVDLNQYVLFPIPAALAFQWFLGGLAEFLLYGALITRLDPIARARSATTRA